ncbi:hypothetical protein O7626_00330 [Micromonospora sp. WMMD1102]|uniref:hypothetical protein n=1 Tax=Micromonospora sp. WMMD1102 TaxID=3016105 RepID=UPI002414DB78|nr:hypothetical protein [Micromonospora sp. WMMD1102]MDG4784392.1 hypothetical protein [Micromonospora sp. WMMD1102]
MSSATYQPVLVATAAGLTPAAIETANGLLADWGHNLGPCRRPFGSEGWVLEVAGRPVSVAVSASTVGSTAAGYPRGELVELARLCSAPGCRWATRVMLRLWREVAGPAWSYWPARAAVAYSQNDRHEGRIYRFDGWRRVTDRAGAPPGPNATWTKHRGPGHPAAGPKSLWLWEYPQPHRPAPADRTNQEGPTQCQ